MDPIVSHGLTFLGGIAVGAGGSYFAEKYTDERRAKEARTASVQRFRVATSEMQGLISAMKQDLQTPGFELVREIVLVRNRNVLFNSRTPCFIYYTSEMPNLDAMVAVLENYGYLRDIRTGNAPKYRLSEEFVAHLLEK